MDDLYLAMASCIGSLAIGGLVGFVFSLSRSVILYSRYPLIVMVTAALAAAAAVLELSGLLPPHTWNMVGLVGVGFMVSCLMSHRGSSNN